MHAQYVLLAASGKEVNPARRAEARARGPPDRSSETSFASAFFFSTAESTLPILLLKRKSGRTPEVEYKRRNVLYSTLVAVVGVVPHVPGDRFAGMAPRGSVREVSEVASTLAKPSKSADERFVPCGRGGHGERSRLQ